MGEDEIALQCLCVRRRDLHRGELAEACIDAIDRLAAFCGLSHLLRCSLDSRARRIREPRREVLAPELFEHGKGGFTRCERQHDTPLKIRSYSGLKPIRQASSAGSSTSQTARSARKPGAMRPQSSSPRARAALTVTPRKASAGVRRNRVQPIFMASRIEVRGEEPGLQSVESAIGTPCSRKAVTGGSCFSCSV